MHYTLSEKEQSMLRITTEQKRAKVILTVEGKLVGDAVGTLEQYWRELRAAQPKEKFVVNLCGVCFIDAAGKVLLKEIHRQGGELLAEGCLNQAIVREVTAKSERPATQKKPAENGKKGGHFFFYVLFLSLLAPFGIRAQSAPAKGVLPAAAPSGTLTLTLDQAVHLALKQNPTAQIAILAAAQSEQDKDVARAELLPSANLVAKDQVLRANIEAQFGGPLPVPGVRQHLGPFQVFSAGTSFGFPVLDLTLWRHYQSARQTLNASRANSLSTREQVILLTVSQYIGALRNIANVNASESRVALAQALYDQAADLQKEGVGTGIDTLRANVELQNEKQRLLEAEADRDTALFGLSKLLNLDPRQELALADSLSFYDTPQPDVEASIDQALAARQEWKALSAQIRASELDRKTVLASRLPGLRIDGDWLYEGTRPNNGIPTYAYQASLTMPLFTGGRIHAEAVRASLEIKKLREQQDDLRNQIALDVKTALINLDSARNQVSVANLGVQLSQQEVDQARDRFKAGVANNIEVIQAQDSLARANDNQIAALFRFNQARADYARSIGQMESIYAK